VGPTLPVKVALFSRRFYVLANRAFNLYRQASRAALPTFAEHHDQCVLTACAAIRCNVVMNEIPPPWSSHYRVHLIFREQSDRRNERQQLDMNRETKSTRFLKTLTSSDTVTNNNSFRER